MWRLAGVLAVLLSNATPSLAQDAVKPGFASRLPGADLPEGLRELPAMRIAEGIGSAIARAPGLSAAQREQLRATPPALLVEQANDPTRTAAALRPYMAIAPGQAGLTTDHAAVALILHAAGDMAPFMPTCSGTLVSPDQVITAAHCVCPWPAYPNWRACLGGTTAAAEADPARLMVFFQHAGARKVTAVSVYDGYNFGNDTVIGDIALLQIDTPIGWIGPASLPGLAAATSRTAMWAAGFGWSATGGGSSIAQRSVSPGLKTSGPVTFIDCGGERQPQLPAQLCIRYLAGIDDGVCGGDSGGPLWSAAGPLQLATTSGGRVDPCLEAPDKAATTQVAMDLAFAGHQAWLARSTRPASTVKPLWPPFGGNLANHLAQASYGYFQANGRYTGGWVSPPIGTLLVTVNSPFPIRTMQVQARDGRTACIGRVTANGGSYVNWCTVEIRARNERYRLVATGADSLPGNVEAQTFQYFIAGLPPGTIPAEAR